MKTKVQVLDAFKEFHGKDEGETRKQLKTAKADNDGDYIRPVGNYCKLYGIRLKKEPTKTPPLNDIAKRMK